MALFLRATISMLRQRNIFSNHLAIDPGTDRTLLYTAQKGIIINEPSVVAVGMNGKSRPYIIAVGEEAGQMLGKAPDQIKVIRPIQEGVIVNSEAACAMLKHFIRIGYQRHKLAGFQAIIAVPSGMTPIETDAAIEVFKSAGASQVFLIKGTIAGAIGAGLPVNDPACNMIVDIGGGTTEVAVISLGGVVISRSVRVGGCHMNNAIKVLIKRKYDLLIGTQSAEKIKTTIGTAYPAPKGDKTIEVKGRHLTTGMPRVIRIGSREIRDAITAEIGAILKTVQTVLEELPPELASDVLDKGILLTGGGALLHDLDQFLSDEFGLTITVSNNPSSTVIHGAGKVLEDLDKLNRFILN